MPPTYYCTTHATPVGIVTIAGDDSGNLAGLWNEGQKYHGGTLSGKMTAKKNLPVFDAAKRWLDNYFAGKKPAISELPLAPIGGEFRQNVWKILCKIPYGKIVTYGDIAKKIAAQTNKTGMSCQAVGGAVGHNPISIIIPCHRVVGAGGSLTGYAGGIRNKITLLKLENTEMDELFVPEKGTAL